MTRTVFDNAMTAHVWAQQSQAEGQSHNGNMFFRGRTLYSYGHHFALGHAMPSPSEPSGFLFLLNDDDSSITTNGKHKPAARRAVPYGSGLCVPGLTRLVDVLAPRYGESTAPKGPELAQRVRRVASHLESACGAYWPGAEGAARILRALGCPEAEAERRARAGAARVARAIAAHDAAEARAKLDSEAGLAKGFAATAPSDTAAEARAKLAEAAGASHWQAERLKAEAAELGREAHRAAKAAKAKGWTRVAARCRAHHKAVRAELARYEADAARYALRAQLRADAKAIRGAPDQIRQFWALHPDAAEGAAVADYRQAVGSCETGAKGFGQLAAALGRIADSAYARASLDGGRVRRIQKQAEAASHTADKLRTRAGQLRTEWQAEARAEWQAGGRPSGVDVGRLCDARGAALLRAEAVERDESGAIIGGTLRTSWGATVPLAHAVRAFRFLRHCRDTATEWRANGRTLPVGHFRIEHVDSAGNFVAGCHRISWAECARVAEGLGLAELAGADTTESSHRVA